LKKMLILLFSILFLGEYVFSDMACVAEETGLLVNLLEPMDLVLSFQFYMLVIPLIFIVLLSGFPDKSGGNIFVMMRVKRRIWLAGQFVFGQLVGVTCLGAFFAASFLWIGKDVVRQNQWSEFMTDTYERFPEIYGQNDRLFLESGTMSHGTPVRVMVMGVLLMLAYLLVMLQILCLFRLMERRKLGLLITMGITVVGATAVSYIKSLKWIFPLTHAIFGEHFDKFYAQPLVPLWFSALYFTVLNGGLLFANLYLVKRCQIADEV
jgi:hypothetical protein